MGAGMEARLEMFCLVLREMRIPIFRCMIMNYANTMICGTKMEAQFKYKEVHRHCSQVCETDDDGLVAWMVHRDDHGVPVGFGPPPDLVRRQRR